jgi:protein required for attachment to host cells
VLLANAARARLFDRDPDNGAMRELAAFVNPLSRAKGSALADDRPGQAMKGQAHTQFQPQTLPREREDQRFAHELAQRLEEAALKHRMGKVALVVSDPFLGVLRAELGDATRALLGRQAAVDLTMLKRAELEARVTDLLGVAEPA